MSNDDSQFAAERVLLTAQFKAAVQTVIETIDANPNLNPVVEDTDSILRLLYLLECEQLLSNFGINQYFSIFFSKKNRRIFSHGLKQMNFFGATTMWHVFAQLPTCLPGTDKFVEQVRQFVPFASVCNC